MLAVAVLTACGGGPIDNTHLAATPPVGQNGTNDLLASRSSTTNEAPPKYLTYEQWEAEKASRARKPLTMTFEQWEEAKKEESRLRQEAERQRIEDEREASKQKLQDEVEAAKQKLQDERDAATRQREEEAQRSRDDRERAEQRMKDEAAKVEEAWRLEREKVHRLVSTAALELAKDYENEQFDPQVLGLKDPAYVIVGMDAKTAFDAQFGSTGTRAKTVSLQGDDVIRYYRENCPVVQGADPIRLQGSEQRQTYECMAGIYVGRNTTGKMCYTFIDRDGGVSHINGNALVFPFRTGNTVSPYPGYVFQDATVTWDQKELDNLPNGPLTFPERDVDGQKILGGVITPSIPVFSRLDAGEVMVMKLNAQRRYPNPIKVVQTDETDKPYRMQMVDFTFKSMEDVIEIKQVNTDSGFGNGVSLNDTCYVNFRTGLSAPGQTGNNAGGGGAGGGSGAAPGSSGVGG